MVFKVFLTGRPGVGKTTVISKLVDLVKNAGFKVGGMISFEVRVSNVRIGFKVKDVLSGSEGWLAQTSREPGPRIGKYRINLREFELVGISALASALRDPSVELLVVDEVGPMELLSPRFREILSEILNSNKNILGTIHYRARDPSILHIKSRRDVKIIEVNIKNRNVLPTILYRRFISCLKSRSSSNL